MGVLVESGDGLLMPESRGIFEKMLLGCRYTHSVAFRCLSGPSINFTRMVEFWKSFREQVLCSKSVEAIEQSIMRVCQQIHSQCGQELHR